MLERVPKLNKLQRQAIIIKRNSLPQQQFTSWDQLQTIPGIGNATLVSLKTFCKNPEDTPIPSPPSATEGSPPHPVLMTTRQEHPKHRIPDALHQLVAYYMQSKATAGDMYQDSGCNRCVGGHEVHETWQKYLATKGLKPVMIPKQEEFLFGNNQTEMSDCAFEYPVFFDNELCGSLDMARIGVRCPALYSNGMMKTWKHVLDFDKQTTRIGAFNKEYPFRNGIPILEIFQIPDQVDLSKVPPAFRLDNKEPLAPLQRTYSVRRSSTSTDGKQEVDKPTADC